MFFLGGLGGGADVGKGQFLDLDTVAFLGASFFVVGLSL